MENGTTTTAGTSAPLHASVPESIGPYRILGKLGEGGMGIVFEAKQKKPCCTVALKVVRGGEFVDEARGKTLDDYLNSRATNSTSAARSLATICSAEKRFFGILLPPSDPGFYLSARIGLVGAGRSPVFCGRPV